MYMKTKRIDWEDLLESDDEKLRTSTLASQTAPRPSFVKAKQPTTTASQAAAANTPATKASAIKAWQNFHVGALAQQKAETAHLPSDYPVPLATCFKSERSVLAGGLHRRGSRYKPQQFDALIRRSQNISKAKKRPRLASSGTNSKRLACLSPVNRIAVSMPRSAMGSRPGPVVPFQSRLPSVSAPSLQNGDKRKRSAAKKKRNQLQRMQNKTTMQRSKEPVYGSRWPYTTRTPITSSRISFGLATSAELVPYMQGKSKPADTTSVPPSRGLSESIWAPRGNHPPATRATSNSNNEMNESRPDTKYAMYEKMVQDFEDRFQIVESDTVRYRYEKGKAEQRFEKALTDLVEANFHHQQYCKRTKDRTKRIQKEWEKKEDEWMEKERLWQLRKLRLQQASPSSCSGYQPVSTETPPPAEAAVATHPTPGPTPSSASLAQPEEIWNPTYPAWFDRGPLLFRCHMKVDPRRPENIIPVHRNDDVGELAQSFADARGLGSRAVALIKEKLVGKRAQYSQKLGPKVKTEVKDERLT